MPITNVRKQIGSKDRIAACQCGSGPLSQGGMAGRGIAQAVQFGRESTEVMDGFGVGATREDRQPCRPVRRDHQDRRRPGQALGESFPAAAEFIAAESGHWRAMGQKQYRLCGGHGILESISPRSGPATRATP